MNTNGGLRAVTAREIRDNLELFLSLAEQGKVFVCDDAVGSLPDSLCTPEAMKIWERLRRAGWVGADCHPVGLSYAHMAMLAMEFGNRMHIRCIWKTFGECWGIKPEVLRSAYNRALGQQQFCKVMEEIRKAMAFGVKN